MEQITTTTTVSNLTGEVFEVLTPQEDLQPSLPEGLQPSLPVLEGSSASGPEGLDAKKGDEGSASGLVEGHAITDGDVDSISEWVMPSEPWVHYPKETGKKRWVVLKPEVKVLVDESWDEAELRREVMIRIDTTDLTEMYVPFTIGEKITGKHPLLFSTNPENGARLQLQNTLPDNQVWWQEVTEENNLHPRAFLEKPWGYKEPTV
jgi:hypothetical protein